MIPILSFCPSLERQKEQKVTGRKDEREMFWRCLKYFFLLCACVDFIKTETKTIKSGLLVTITPEVLIAEQGSAVPMADRVLGGINLLAFPSWWNLARLKMCLQESRITCYCFVARSALNLVYLLLRQAGDGIAITVDDIFF